MPNCSPIPLRLAALAGLALAGIPAAGPQSRDTLGTKITAEGNQVLVAWDKHHPWDAQLRGRGADLVAEYRTENRGVVSEAVGHAAGAAEDRLFRFTLPAMVHARPLGPICLYVQPAGGRALLPVRKAGQGGDTARFRYEPWEKAVLQTTMARVGQARVTAWERELQLSAQRVAAEEAVVAKRGWRDPAACDAIPAPQAQEMLKPYGVVEPVRQEETARRVCVYRVWYGRQLVARISPDIAATLAKLASQHRADEAKKTLAEVFSVAYTIPEAAGPLLEKWKKVAGPLAPGVREQQAAEFLKDWERLTPGIETYDPHLGKPKEYLRWPSSAAAVAFRVLGPFLAGQLKAEWAMAGEPAPAILDLAGFIGAAMDAYFDCVNDNQKQLAFEYENWQALQASEPQHEARKREFLVRECRQELGRLDQLKTAHAALQQQLAREKQSLETAAAPLPGKSQALNFAACRAQ